MFLMLTDSRWPGGGGTILAFATGFINHPVAGFWLISRPRRAALLTCGYKLRRRHSVYEHLSMCRERCVGLSSEQPVSLPSFRVYVERFLCCTIQINQVCDVVHHQLTVLFDGFAVLS